MTPAEASSLLSIREFLQLCRAVDARYGKMKKVTSKLPTQFEVLEVRQQGHAYKEALVETTTPDGVRHRNAFTWSNLRVMPKRLPPTSGLGIPAEAIIDCS